MRKRVQQKCGNVGILMQKLSTKLRKRKTLQKVYFYSHYLHAFFTRITEYTRYFSGLSQLKLLSTKNT